MLEEAPLAAALAVVLAANVLLTWLFGRRLDRGSSAGPVRVDRSAGTIECPVCGAENDLDYRFCRGCVEELPAATGSIDTTTRPVRRDLN